MRNYVRVSERHPISPQTLRTFKTEWDNGKSSIRSLARSRHLNEATLRKALKRGHTVEKLGRYRSVFSKEQEDELVTHLTDLDNRFFGISLLQLRQLAFQFAEKNSIPHPFNTKNKLTGKDWAVSFRNRHNLSLRVPQKTSVARAMGFNKSQVDLFFKNLSELLKRFNFEPRQIFNMDETGLSTVPNFTPKVVSIKGKKTVGRISSAERGQLVTAVCCYSAQGNYVPPALIFPRIRNRPELLRGAPAGSIMFCSDSGYIHSEIFVEWLKHFKTHTQPSAQNNILLILDNHVSHVSLDAAVFCKQNSIHLLTIPPHSSQKLQPLDRSFFAPLKKFYGVECNNWLTNHPGEVISQSHIAEIFSRAYSQVATTKLGQEGFRSCGIVPYNPNIFSDVDFLPSTVTDQSQIFELEKFKEIEVQNEAEAGFSLTETPTTSAQVESSISNGSSEGERRVSPSDILPLPKIKTQRKRQPRGKKSTVVTASPNVENLKLEKKVREDKETKVNNRKMLVENTKKVNKAKQNKKPVTQMIQPKRKAACKKQLVFLKGPLEKATPSEEEYCLICSEPYSNSKSKEIWIQCNACELWAHKECTTYNNIGFYMCDLCQKY